MRAIEISSRVKPSELLEVKQAWQQQTGVVKVRDTYLGNDEYVIKAYFDGKGIKQAQLPDGCKIVSIG